MHFHHNSAVVLICAEFVDALSAPIQALSMAEKREKQMKDMGIDEKDISDVPVIRKHHEKASNGQISQSQQLPANSSGGAKKDDRKGERGIGEEIMEENGGNITLG